MEETKIYVSGRKTALMLLLLASLLAIMVFMLAVDKEPYDPTFFSYQNILTSSIIVLSVGFCVVLLIWLRKKPALILSQNGVHIHTSIMQALDLEWGEITEIDVKTVFINTYVKVGLVDPQKIINQARGLNKFSLRNNWRQHKTPVLISAAMLPIEAEALARLLKKQWEERGGTAEQAVELPP